MARKYRGSYELIARGVIVHDNKILICQTKGHDWWYLPGGHIEHAEHAKTTMNREIQEELGVKVKKTDYIGTVENIFDMEVNRGDFEKFHEINMVFSVQLENYNVQSQEEHIHFKWVSVDELSEVRIEPTHLKQSIIDWINSKEKKYFWSSTLGK